MANIYVASSWRNPRQPDIVKLLRRLGHEVYDFREGDAFGWHEIDPDWKDWSPGTFREGLKHPLAKRGFARDMGALEDCDTCVLVMPCGRSAHLEAGWAKGAGKRVIVLLADGEPELMLAMADVICTGIDELIQALSGS